MWFRKFGEGYWIKCGYDFIIIFLIVRNLILVLIFKLVLIRREQLLSLIYVYSDYS